jgi:hypothetical protein
LDDGVVIEVDGAGDALGDWPRARLRKRMTPSSATKTIAQISNIPREEGGCRCGS